MQIKPRNEGRPGTWIAVEGVDGAGKTSVIEMLVEKLKRQYPDREIVRLRAPDGSIRNILLNRTEDFHPRVELLLYAASHLQLLASQITPAVLRGAIVIQDRYIDSLMAYQGYGRDLKHLVSSVHGQFLNNAQPDHTLYVQASEEICEKRLESRGLLDFMDKEGLVFKRRVRAGMEAIMQAAIQNHKRVSAIRNEGTVEQLQDSVDDWISTWTITAID